MQPHAFQPLVEAFLIVEQPRQRLGHWSTVLAPLDDGRAPPLATVAAYYDPTADQALIALRYDELALGVERLAFVVEIALLAEIGMIQPAELTEGDRRRFIGERLARCTMHVGDQRSVVGSVVELVRRLREHKAGARTPAVLPPRVPAARAPIQPRPATLDDPDPILLVKAKATRNDIAPLESPRAHRAATVQMSADESMRMAAQCAPEPSTRLGTEPPVPSGPTPPGIIYARYLRSGKWVPIRIGALSLKGAALMAGALPRLHDHVDIALSFGAHRALVRGPVKKVSTKEEMALSGTATFSIAFELDDGARRQLTSLLTAARAAHVTIKPPPPRTTRRYPVEWPVCLGTVRGAVRGEALDVSREGMFVRPLHPLTIDSTLNFSIVLDDIASPISGRAKVVRQIHEAEARTCGLAAGYGLRIIDLAVTDRERWLRFLARIDKRADKRVLVGASPKRLAELQAALSAAGYAVTGGTDPGALAQLAGAERPVDAVLLDGSIAPGPSLTSMFSSRSVPCVTLAGDARRGRIAIDKLLSVV